MFLLIATRRSLLKRNLVDLDILPEDGAEAGQLIELLAADVEGGEDLDVAAKLPHGVHQTHEPLPLRHVLKQDGKPIQWTCGGEMVIYFCSTFDRM